jgi:hypothetical protein
VSQQRRKLIEQVFGWMKTVGVIAPRCAGYIVVTGGV